MTHVIERMKELCAPVEQQILMCDSSEEILMMACAMLTHVKTMLDSQIGVEGRKTIIGDANND
jgi:hypothetical protein|tara:strand:+ start:482 stop:670 length:189 start_codon:yes stop_codon:yes gene_type:complete